MDMLELKLAYLSAELILSKRKLPPAPTPPDLSPMEDWERPDPNAPLPMWNLWGDAGLLTRPDIYSAYSKDGAISPVHTEG